MNYHSKKRKGWQEEWRAIQERARLEKIKQREECDQRLLQLPERPLIALLDNKITSLEELSTWTEKELLKFRNVGKITISHYKKLLNKFDLSLVVECKPMLKRLRPLPKKRRKAKEKS